MKSHDEHKRMAVDAMVKHSDNEEIYGLAQAVEELAEYAELAAEERQQEVLNVQG